MTVALGPDDRAIPSPCCPPGVIEIWRTNGDREFRRELFVNLDAQAGLLLRQHVAVLGFGTARKYFLRLLREITAFTRDLKTVKQGNSIMAFSFETLDLGILKSSECMSKITRGLTVMWSRLN